MPLEVLVVARNLTIATCARLGPSPNTVCVARSYG
jgi:hypothetical protein